MIGIVNLGGFLEDLKNILVKYPNENLDSGIMSRNILWNAITAVK